MKQIRYLNSNDLDQVYGLIEAQAERNPDLKRFGAMWSRNQVTEYLNKGVSLGLFSEDKLHAVILGRSIDSQIYEIDLTMTHPDFLRKGFIKDLFKNLSDNLKQKNYIKVWLEVHEENVLAIGLYKSLGFLEESRRAKYYPDQKAAILMTYTLISP